MYTQHVDGLNVNIVNAMKVMQKLPVLNYVVKGMYQQDTPYLKLGHQSQKKLECDKSLKFSK